MKYLTAAPVHGLAYLGPLSGLLPAPLLCVAVCRSPSSRTPMHYASYYALKENVEALWQYNPDLALLDRYNRSESQE